MPNWVENVITITGKQADLEAFAAKAQTPHVISADGELSETSFSFMNFIAPDPDKLDLYFETNGWTKDPNTGESIHTGNTEYNWYNWNIANWDTKWDAVDAELETFYGTNSSISIHYNTAWSPSRAVYVAMSEQHPELTFEIFYEEEQGWGGRGFAEDGLYFDTQEWDVPTSHEDYENLERECPCEYSNYQFADCPKETANV